MTRVPMVPVEGLDPELRALIRADERTGAQLGNLPLYAHNPEIAKAFVHYQSALRSRGSLPRRVVELVRLRVAFHNQCARCMSVRYGDGVDDGVTEELVCQLSQPETAPDLSAAERAAIRFADLMATDHEAIDESLFEELHRHFTDPQIIELGMGIAMNIGFGRLSRALDSVDDVPGHFLATGSGEATPWAGPGVVIR
jgi:AhpD family alkylhydroperoxidase